MKYASPCVVLLLGIYLTTPAKNSFADEKPATADVPRFAVPFPDLSKPAAGYRVLEGVEHFPIFHATEAIGTYSHHAQLAHRDGTFFAAWSNHKEREDGPGQRVFASLSTDGRLWDEPFELFPSQGPTEPGNKEAVRVLTALAWVPVGEQMYAVAEVNNHGRVARSVSADGQLGPVFWLIAKPPATVDGFASYPASTDPRFSGVAATIVDHLAEPMNLPSWDFYNDAARRKMIGFHKKAADGHRMCEPTTYRRPDGVYVRLYRDLESTHRIYASLSRDNGRSWAEPEPTDIPDSPSRSFSGNLPDGRCYLIGNQVAKPFDQKQPQHHTRDPLVISVSRDGIVFDLAAAIRTGAPKIRVRGHGKGKGYQYPAATIVGDDLWVLYSIGKEDVAISRVPLDLLSE